MLLIEHSERATSALPLFDRYRLCGRWTAEWRGGPIKDTNDSDYSAGDDLTTTVGFTAFYRRHCDEVLRYFYRRTADADVAADLCAETFALALQNAAQFDRSRGEPVQWLCGIARRELAKFWRRHQVDDRARKRLGISTEPIDSATADELRRVEDLVDSDGLLQELESLPEKLREAVALRVLHQLEYADIAADLGCTAAAARVRVFRGLEQLGRGMA